MALFVVLKAALGFVMGAGLGSGLTWLIFLRYSYAHPLPAQQLGDMFLVIAYALAAIVLTVLMGLVGGIAGVMVMRHIL